MQAAEVVDQSPAAPDSSASRYSAAEPLFRRLAGPDTDDPARAPLRSELITIHLPLARNLARRFANRGESLDDLSQVATIGLIQAVERFDPARGVDFLSFAIPTITGEIKRHFRDRGWHVRVPRRLQELRADLARATAELSQRTGRAPTASELAAHLDRSREEIVEGLQAANAYAAVSLDRPAGPEEDAPTLGETFGEEDADLALIDSREALLPLLKQLPTRERRILYLRFVREQTQTQIAQEIGVSQMHVSRLLAATLTRLRQGMLTD
ncbi:RNA polymerase sigma factor SigF [Cryptosporangium sp. NPDC048952]|uniref:RNA polymerase sigma factor SigF n=1 Tax=Cryptosporangium sp. NPDC048952 TaxID=3363961 RepID=UPI003715FC71